MNLLKRGIDQGVEKPQFKCPQCPDKVYSSHHQLSNHTLEHIRSACDICGKSVRKPKLRHHKKAVHGEKTLFCPQCNLGFSIKREVKRHILTVHEKPHKCNLCGKGFGTESLLEQHKGPFKYYVIKILALLDPTHPVCNQRLLMQYTNFTL